MTNEKWKEARLKIEEAIYILKENYEQTFIILDVVTSLTDTLEHLNNMEE